MLALMVLAYLTLLVAGSELLRHAPRWACGFWILVAIAMFPRCQYLAVYDEWTWFAWLKYYSVWFAGAFVAGMAALGARAPKLVLQTGAWTILIVNILEAVGKDVSFGLWPNAVAGALVAALALRPVRVAAETRPYEMHFEVSFAWVLAYSLWNFAFIFGHWDGVYIAQHTAVLGAPLALALFRGADRYLQARAYTLGLHLFGMALAFEWYEASFFSPQLYWGPVYGVLVGLALALALALFGRAMLARFRTPATPPRASPGSPTPRGRRA